MANVGNSIEKLISAYQSKLTGTDLEKFKAMSRNEQLSIAMVKINYAAPTDLGALSNLDPKNQGKAQTSASVLPFVIKSDKDMGLVIERSDDVKIPNRRPDSSDMASEPVNPTVEAPAEESSKKTKYVVQLGDTIEGLVRKSLKAQGIENPDENKLKEAVEQFKEENSSIIKSNKRGTYLLAGKEAILRGEVDVSGNKTAEQVKDEFRRRYPSKKESEAQPGKTEAAPASAERKPSTPKAENSAPPAAKDAVTPPKNEPAPQSNVPGNNPSAEVQKTDQATTPKVDTAKAPKTATRKVSISKASLEAAGIEIKPNSRFTRGLDGNLVQEYQDPGQIKRKEIYGKDNKLVKRESSYMSGDLKTEVFENGIRKETILKTKEAETRFVYDKEGKNDYTEKTVDGKQYIYDVKKKMFVEMRPETDPANFNNAMKNRVQAILKASQRLGTDEDTFIQNLTRNFVSLKNGDKYDFLTKEEYSAIDKYIKQLNVTTPKGYQVKGLKEWIENEFDLKDTKDMNNVVIKQIYDVITRYGL